MKKRMVLCYTVPMTFNFATSTIHKLVEDGWDVMVVSSNETQLKAYANSNNIAYHCIEFSRGYNIMADLKALWHLIKFLKSYKPNIVIGATPKAGLLSMIASKIVGIPHRIYHIFGFPFETATKLKRRILLNVERLTSFCATNVLPISNSIGKVCLQEKIVKEPKLCLAYKLTIGGVDLSRFDANLRETSSIREELGFDANDIVIGFVGRLTIDKGVYDFIKVAHSLQQKYSNLKYLIIGNNDSRVPIDMYQVETFMKKYNTVHIPYTDKIERYYAAMDILLLPSYREGFGNSNVEAQAMKIPVVCYEVTGCVDSVRNDVSGIMSPIHDVSVLTAATERLILDKELRKTMGENGRKYVKENFTDQIVANNNLQFITNIQKTFK